MKKITTLFAVGVVALGASAQAAQVESSEYAVITIPVHAGNNLIGISVNATEVSIPSVLKGINTTDSVKVWNGSAYSAAAEAQNVDVSTGSSFFLMMPEGTESFNAYELGAAPSETAPVPVSVSSSMAIVAPPYASDWSLDDLTFSTTSSTRYSKANRVCVWNGTGYDYYWYLPGSGWRNKVNGGAVPSSFGAGQAVFVQLGGGASSGKVTFAAKADAAQ